LIVRQPGKIQPGSNSDLPSYFADVLPTLAELTASEIPGKVDGQSFLKSLHGEKQDFSSRYMYWEFYEKDGWRAARFGDWKAIQQNMHKKEHDAIEIYNLHDDVSEKNNLVTDYPDIVKKAEQIFEEAHLPSDHYTWAYLEK
jgi:arylsulfatase A-like enzyme